MCAGSSRYKGGVNNLFKLKTVVFSGAIALILNHASALAAETKPLRALLIAGGCCHDYAAQKDILKKGIEARANVVVDIIYSPDTSTHPPLPILGHPDYADGYDVVIHDDVRLKHLGFGHC